MSPLAPSGGGCVYDSGVGYNGGVDIPLNSSLHQKIQIDPVWPKVATPKLCCQLCEATTHANGSAYCRFFTHDEEQQTCYLKASINHGVVKEEKASMTSGACRVGNQMRTWQTVLNLISGVSAPRLCLSLMRIFRCSIGGPGYFADNCFWQSFACYFHRYFVGNILQTSFI